MPVSVEDGEVIHTEHRGKVACELCGDSGDWLHPVREGVEVHTETGSG